MRIVETVLAAVAPPLCPLCRAGCGVGGVVCGSCRGELNRCATGVERSLPGLDSCRAAALHEGAARDLVISLKFSGRLGLAGLAAELIASGAAMGPTGGLVAATTGMPVEPIATAVEPDEEASAILVPVPADPWRLRWRGFDPAAEIARQLGRRLDIPVIPALARSHGRRQVGRPREERIGAPMRVQVRGFAHHGAGAPRAAILVDDVITTGATVTACAAALREAGFARVGAVCFATRR